jgi:hypothetical protein
VSNPQNSASISGSTLTITGAFRNMSYPVTTMCPWTTKCWEDFYTQMFMYHLHSFHTKTATLHDEVNTT